MVEAHRRLPFHQIQHWTGSMFVRKTLKDMGLRIQLGHWDKPNQRCPVPSPASGDDFVIVDTHGVHEVGLDYCGWRRWVAYGAAAARATVPATTTNPRSAATFGCSVYEFYQSLARETDNMRHKEAKAKKGAKSADTPQERRRRMKIIDKQQDRYDEFVRMTREWRHIHMLKRAGAGTIRRALRTQRRGRWHFVPCMPHPDKNLPVDYKDAPERSSKDVSTEAKDPGWARVGVYCEVRKYMEHVRKFWNEKQE
ncbi:hypothetical protein FB451DRAFT_1467534, partial [Mycena latifolia]